MLLPFTPIIDKTIPTCAHTCQLTEWGYNSFPNPPVISFDSQSGSLEIQSSDYGLDGLELQLKLICSTPYSIQSASETQDIDYFQVYFTSECRENILTAPSVSDTNLSIELWKTYEIPFISAFSSNSYCGDIHYTCVGASSPLVTLNHDSGMINILGTDKVTETGEFSFKIKACLWNDLYWEEINCVYSEVVYFTVVDPCFDTSLNVF